DLAGNALASPTAAGFTGTAPSGAEIVDTDHDGLPDNVEQRGWIVSVKLANGTVVQRGVSSDPFKADTDGDGLGDKVEMALSLDPRSADTDADGLTDSQEHNEIYSDPANQDTDGDHLPDGQE